MPRYKLTIEYNGAGFAGWQKQVEQLSVQTTLEAAIAGFCGQQVNTITAGRTDAGVHAIAQVAHVDLPQLYEPFRVMQGINFHLRVPGGDPSRGTNAISVTAVDAVSDEFSARFSAKARHYMYRIVNRRAALALEHQLAWHIPVPLDVEGMREAAKYLVGHHDFTSFRDAQCQAKSPVKTLDGLRLEQLGHEIRIHATARSFLHHQVRIMVGSLVQVGLGKWEPEQMKRALEAKTRSSGGPTSPPDGLYLVGVDY